jgi:hypothetical protein
MLPDNTGLTAQEEGKEDDSTEHVYGKMWILAK